MRISDWSSDVCSSDLDQIAEALSSFSQICCLCHLYPAASKHAIAVVKHGSLPRRNAIFWRKKMQHASIQPCRHRLGEGADLCLAGSCKIAAQPVHVRESRAANRQGLPGSNDHFPFARVQADDI